MANRSKIPILARKCAIEILIELTKSPKRFTDLSKVCPNEKSRSFLLKKMEKINLITTSSLKFKKRYFVHYKITPRGKYITKKILEIKKILENK